MPTQRLQSRRGDKNLSAKVKSTVTWKVSEEVFEVQTGVQLHSLLCFYPWWGHFTFPHPQSWKTFPTEWWEQHRPGCWCMWRVKKPGQRCGFHEPGCEDCRKWCANEKSVSFGGQTSFSAPEGSPYSPELSPFASKEFGEGLSRGGRGGCLILDSWAAQSIPFMTFGSDRFYLGSIATCLYPLGLSPPLSGPT